MAEGVHLFPLITFTEAQVVQDAFLRSGMLIMMSTLMSSTCFQQGWYHGEMSFMEPESCNQLCMFKWEKGGSGKFIRMPKKACSSLKLPGIHACIHYPFALSYPWQSFPVCSSQESCRRIKWFTKLFHWWWPRYCQNSPERVSGK